MSILSANPETLAIQRNYDEIRSASLAARRSFDQFLHAFHHRGPGQEGFMVRVFFTHRRRVHHVWMKDLDLSSSTALSGVFAEETGLPDLRLGQRHTFTRDRITDWKYTHHGKTVGAYTDGVLKRQSRPPRLSGLRRALGMNLPN